MESSKKADLANNLLFPAKGNVIRMCKNKNLWEKKANIVPKENECFSLGVFCGVYLNSNESIYVFMCMFFL